MSAFYDPQGQAVALREYAAMARVRGDHASADELERRASALDPQGPR